MNPEYVLRSYVEDKRDKLFQQFGDLSIQFTELMHHIENHTNYTAEEWEEISSKHEDVIKTMIKLESDITCL